MKIDFYKNHATGETIWHIKVSDQFVASECEPYAPVGSPILDAITNEQGLGIVTDAILMAMHLKLRSK